MDEQTFDVIVIGAGPAGETLAGRVANGGLRTAIVESERVGGECSFWACIPSKTLLRPSAVIDAARRVAGVASTMTGTVDAPAVLQRRDEAVANYDDAGQAKWLEENQVTLLRGKGRLDGARRVIVESGESSSVSVATEAVVLATGSVPVIPQIPGLEDVPYWTSREATSAPSVPARLVVVGGGVVAVELAQAWRFLGASEVTLLVRSDRLLDREEPFVGEAIAGALRDQGVTIEFATEVAAVAHSGDSVDVTLGDGRVLNTDEILIATGRRPNTGGLGLDSVGLPSSGPVEVDDHLRATGVEGGWLYAVGDVNGRSLLTHMGKYQARIAADVLLQQDSEGTHFTPPAAKADDTAVPGVVFTNPQVASVGLRLAEALDRGLQAREVQVPLSSAAGAYVNGDQEGTFQVVIDDERGVIVGATLVGPEVAEMLQAATIAIVGEVPLAELWHAVPAFPTVSEVWLRMLEAYEPPS